jgi:para-aminobenzoate synthetase component 1
VTAHKTFTIIPYQGRLLKFSRPVSARAYFKNHYIDLLTGINHEHDVGSWLNELDFKIHQHQYKMRFIHLFYELGFLFESMEAKVNIEDMMGIDIQYSNEEFIELDNSNNKIKLELISSPDFADYKKQFAAGFNELNIGNCYQFNLTGEYLYSFDKQSLDASDFISTLWRDPIKRGAYASATYIESLNKLLLSNSPECLFQYRAGTLIARPIKGTVKRKTDEMIEINSLWKEMSEDKKSQGELYMITDLLRNDLSRIDLPVSTVTKKKAMLLVPGLVHQYSEIVVKLRPHITLRKVLEKIFPGGSITGAPKKRTMKILKRLEARSRGFYCGSTIYFSAEAIEASINIRSSVIDFNLGTLSYQAGGGITLLSEVLTEFEEMTYKHDSYIDILTL